MPNAFQFIAKATGEAENFNDIDEKLCAFLGVPVDPAEYHRGWYDCFGWPASMGQTFAEMRERGHARDAIGHKMLDWLDEHYTINAWYAPRG